MDKVQLLAKQEKWPGCRAGPRLGRPAGQTHCFIRQLTLAAKPVLPVQRLHYARRSCCAWWTGEAWQPSLRWGQAGSRPGSRPTSLASPREV